MFDKQCILIMCTFCIQILLEVWFHFFVFRHNKPSFKENVYFQINMRMWAYWFTFLFCHKKTKEHVQNNIFLDLKYMTLLKNSLKTLKYSTISPLSFPQPFPCTCFALKFMDSISLVIITPPFLNINTNCSMTEFQNHKYIKLNSSRQAQAECTHGPFVFSSDDFAVGSLLAAECKKVLVLCLWYITIVLDSFILESFMTYENSEWSNKTMSIDTFLFKNL